MPEEVAELLAAPYEVWVAPVGTAFPAVTASVTGEWKLLGKLGAKNYSDAGVTVTTHQTLGKFTPAGGTWERKSWRTDEGLDVAFDLADLRPEQFALVLDNATVTKNTGAKTESLSLSRGTKVHNYALLARGPSPLNEAKNAQFQVPACYQAGNPAPKFAPKSGVSLLSVQFTAIEIESGATPEFFASE